MVLSFALPSYAASLNFTLSSSFEKQSLRIAGTTDAERMLTFYVTDSGVSAADMNFDKNIYAMHQLTAGNDGSFDTTLKLPDTMTEGTYKLIIGGLGTDFDEAQRSREFDYMPIEGKAYVLEAETATGTTNWSTLSESSASGGKLMYIYENTPSFTTDDAKLTWSFDVEDSTEYDIFVILNQTGGHTSSHCFSVNGDTATSSESIISKALYSRYFSEYSAGMYWARVRSDVFIEAGTASITYKPTYSSLYTKRILTGIDAVYVVPSSWNWEPYKLTSPYDAKNLKVDFNSASLSSSTAERGGQLTAALSISVPTGVSYNAPVWAELRYKGEKVVYEQTVAEQGMDTWSPGTAHSVSLTLDIPVVAPDGEYEVYCGVGSDSGFANVDGEKCIGSITIGETTEPNPDTLTISSVKTVQDGKTLNVSYTLSEAADVSTAKAFVRFLSGDVLWGVAESEAAVDVKTVGESVSIALTMPSGMPSGTYEAELGFYNVNGTKTIGDMEIVSDAKNTYKPLSYGIYKSQKSGRHHFWYINQHGAAIWDGEPFVPVGGMYCPNILQGYSFVNPETNNSNWTEDKREIDMLADNGITDIYLNSSINGTPGWVWEYVLDYLDKKGIRYGIQPNGGNGYTEQDAFYIFSNAKKISTSATAVSTTNAKTVKAEDVTLSTIGSATANYAYYFAVHNNSGTVKAGKAELTADGNVYTFSADIVFPKIGSYTIYFTPCVNKSTGVVNFWKYGENMLNKAKSFAKNVAMGDGARDIIDVATNESGYYNTNANARPYDADYNALYRDWLKKKYNNIGELTDAWKTNDTISGFDQASRIIPVYSSAAASDGSYSVYGYDEQSNALFEFDGRNTQMWLDFIEFRDYAAAEFYNDLADAYKTKLDLPTVIKSVYFHQESFKNERTSGGLDGLGSESYAVGESVGQKHVVTYALSNQFAKTAWNIVTETNVEENITQKFKDAYGENPTYTNGQPDLVNSGGLGYGTKARMHTNFDQLFDSGAKGIYDFVLGARHSTTIQQAYSYVYMNDYHKSTNDQFGWLAEYKAKVDEEKIANSDPDKNIIYFTPAAAYTNGGGPNRFNAVHTQDHSTITYSYKSSGTNRDYMVLLTDDPNVEAEVIAANFEKGPISQKQGVEFGKMLDEMPEDKQAVYLGFRSDLGTVPQLDKYFTNTYTTNSDGVKVQVLDPGSTGEVIYKTSDGKPWAIRDGNLWIVAAENWISGGKLQYIDNIGVFMDSDDTVLQDFGFTDENGAKLDAVKMGDSTLSIRIKNNTTDETDAVMYAASYDGDGNLLSVSKKVRTLFSGLNYIETELSVDENAASAKGFVWDMSMKPLTDVLEIRK